MDLFSFDRTFRRTDRTAIAGVDEAGRGPWAGPVVAAAVVLPDGAFVEGLDDSKKLTPLKRERLFERIHAAATAVGVETVDNLAIDSTNILAATFAAMRGALARLNAPVDLVLVDGDRSVPGIAQPQKTLVGGDALSAAVAAASVIAKVTRDRLMVEYARVYPDYGFERHKGYGARQHREALERYGPCPIHRRSFAPVRDLPGGFRS